MRKLNNYRKWFNLTIAKNHIDFERKKMEIFWSNNSDEGHSKVGFNLNDIVYRLDMGNHIDRCMESYKKLLLIANTRMEISNYFTWDFCIKCIQSHDKLKPLPKSLKIESDFFHDNLFFRGHAKLFSILDLFNFLSNWLKSIISKSQSIKKGRICNIRSTH